MEKQQEVSPLRVIRFVDDYPQEGKSSFGLQPVFYYLSREQARLGLDVQVIAKREGLETSNEIHSSVNIHRVSEPFNLNAYLELRKLLSDNSPSIIHTHATSGLFLAGLRKTMRAPVVSHVHGTTRSHHMPVTLKFGDVVYDYSALKVAYYYVREKTLWSSADQVVTVSEAIKADLVRSYKLPSDKITVVYNGVDEKLFYPIKEPKLPDALKALVGKKIVLYVGHFGLRKGLIYLIRAMKRVVAEVPDAVLLCIGGVPKWLGQTNYWNVLRTIIEENDLSDKVFLKERIPNAELPNYYSAASAFVLPSYYEAFGKVVIEAMACGVPVVATRIGGLQEVVDENVSGFLMKYGAVKEIEEALVNILQDERLARQMGLAGRKRVERDFTWNVVAKRLNLVYSEALREYGLRSLHQTPVHYSG